MRDPAIAGAAQPVFTKVSPRQRISAFGVLEVRRRLKSAENNAHRKKIHLKTKIDYQPRVR